MKKKIFIPLIISIIFVIFSCVTKRIRPIDKVNLSFLYNPSSSNLHPSFKIFHRNDSLSLLFFKIYPSEFLFRKDYDTISKAKIKISYKLLTSFSNNNILDSSSVILSLEKGENSKEFTSFLKINAPFPQKYLLQVEVKDLNRKIITKKFLVFDKSNEINYQNFSFLNKYKTPKFHNFVKKNDTFYIAFKRKKIDKLYIKYYKNNFSVSSAPYSQRNLQDIAYEEIKEVKYNKNLAFSFEKEGCFLIQTDKNSSDGLLIINYGNSFPFVKKAKNMFFPLEYLASKKEFEDFNKNNYKKEIVDKFWLQATGNLERAKELIRIYYTRVFWSNLYFSTYKEGWKTDRGMVYLIYGIPTKILKSELYEKWIYGKKYSPKYMNFIFKKNEKSISYNDYNLIPNPKKENWLEAIDTWRNGRIFSIDLK